MGNIENHRCIGVVIWNNMDAPEKKRIFPVGLIGNVVSPRKAEKIIRLEEKGLIIDRYLTVAGLAPKQHAAFHARG